MWNARLDESQAGIKTARKNINNLKYADDITLMAESEEELKSLLMKVKESEKAGLKFNIKKTKIMASSPITLWQIEGEKLYIVVDFIFLGSKITADSDFANKGPYSQSYGFSSSPVWIWELDHKEDWEPKNWCFRTVVLEKTSESPLDCKEIRPVNPKGNQPEYSLEGLMLRLQHFGHLMQRANSLEKTLMLGKIESKRRRGQQRMRWLDSITDSTDMNLSKPWEIVEDRWAWCVAVHRVEKSQAWLSDWKTSSSLAHLAMSTRRGPPNSVLHRKVPCQGQTENGEGRHGSLRLQCWL